MVPMYFVSKSKHLCVLNPHDCTKEMLNVCIIKNAGKCTCIITKIMQRENDDFCTPLTKPPTNMVKETSEN